MHAKHEVSMSNGLKDMTTFYGFFVTNEFCFQMDSGLKAVANQSFERIFFERNFHRHSKLCIIINTLTRNEI